QSDYNKAVNLLNQSKFQYEAAQNLYNEGAISQEELLKAKVAYENDSTTVNSFSNLDQTNVKSPITGTVTRVNTSQGRAANDTKNKEAMFVIEDLANLQMKVKIGEFDISKIAKGQTVKITADVMGDETVTGVVSTIAPTGELKDPASKEMVVPVTIDVNKGNTKLMAGVSAKADILIQRSEQVVSVPIDALMEDPTTGKNYIFLVKDKKLKKTEVALGVEGNFTVEIRTDKVKAGDVVVLSPTFDFTDGMLVSTEADMQQAGGKKKGAN
ncbi:MAG: efflux RND transporter periplasmic adaptor subunit, partial [Anaerovorax sp.]